MTISKMYGTALTILFKKANILFEKYLKKLYINALL